MGFLQPLEKPAPAARSGRFGHPGAERPV